MITFTGGKWAFGVMVAVMALLMAVRQDAGAAGYGTIGSGNWSNTAIWTSSTVPGVGDTAIITNGFTVTITGAVQQVGSVGTVNMGYGVGTGNKGPGTLVVSNGASLTTTNINVGYSGTVTTNGFLYIDGSSVTSLVGNITIKGPGGFRQGSVLKVSNGGNVWGPAISMPSTCNGAQVIITNGSSMRLSGNNSNFGGGGTTNNLVYVGGKKDGVLSQLYTANQFVGSGVDNLIIVDEGGWASLKLYLDGNSCLVVTNGGVYSAASTTYIGNSGDSGARVIVFGADASGARSTFDGSGTTFEVGHTNSCGNGLLISNGGIVSNTLPLSVGPHNTCSNNYVKISNGGILQLNITVGAAGNAGNVVSNDPGGILQFTTDTPTITVNNPNANLSLGNAFIITNGIVSFKGTTVSLTNNWAGSLAPSNNITWQGSNNILRLDGTKGTASGAYTFSGVGSPTNYAGLELFNSASLVSNQSVSIGTSVPSQGGSLVVSNGTFSIRGVVTNYSPNVNLANVTSLVASNGIVWGDGSAATTTPGTVTFDAITTNRLDSGTVAWIQSATTATQVVNGVVLGTGGLRKSGPGVLILSGNNKYAGGTTVSNGTLQVNGVITGNVSVASAATLSVAGSVTGAVSVASGGFLSGTGTVAGAMTNAGVIYAVVTNATPPVLNITGSLTLQAGSQLVLAGESTNYLANSSSSTLTIIHASGGLNGTTFTTDNVPEGWRLSYDNVGGYVRLQPGYPGTMILFQ